MSLAVSPAFFDIDLDLDALKCLIFDMDGIYVPFFIDQWRMRGSESYLVKLDGVDNEIGAQAFVGKDVWALKTDLPETDEDDGYLSYEQLIGYTIEDTDGSVVGRITDVDDSTDNILFDVERPDGDRALVPAAAELVVDVNPDACKIVMNLPTGLFD